MTDKRWNIITTVLVAVDILGVSLFLLIFR